MDQMMPPQESPQEEVAEVTVCISKNPDGSFHVYPEEPEGQSPADPAMMAQGEAQEDKGEPLKTIEEALKMAQQMLEGGSMSVEQAFSNGYEGQ